MAPRIRNRQVPPKRPKDPSRGYFYPGEVVQILGLEGLDYSQLRRLFRLVRKQDSLEPSARKWSRFTFRDLVSLKAAFDIAGGEAALRPGKHLQLLKVERLCERLKSLGLSNPLAEVVFRLSGKEVVAKVDGLWLEPANGQMILAAIGAALDRYLDQLPNQNSARKKWLRRELQREITDARKNAAEHVEITPEFFRIAL